MVTKGEVKQLFFSLHEWDLCRKPSVFLLEYPRPCVRKMVEEGACVNSWQVP
jgi:hypothetical protein